VRAARRRSLSRLGQSRPGEPVPDCAARLEGDTVLKLVVDAKAGTWNAPTEVLRAMMGYVREFGGPRAYPVFAFVVGRLRPDVRQRRAGAMVGSRDAVAITGHQLAELVVKRLTRPELMMEAEVTRLLRGGGVRRGRPCFSMPSPSTRTASSLTGRPSAAAQ
jgi:hypothetical protein